MQGRYALLGLRTAVAVVWSVGSVATVPYLDVLSFRQDILTARPGMGLHLDFHQEIHRSQGSSAAADVVDAADEGAAIVLGPVVGSAVVRVVAHTVVSRVVAHTVVSQAAAHTVAVGWGYCPVEGDSVVVGVREGMWAVVGRIGLLEEGQSTAVGAVGLVCVRLLFRGASLVA